MDLEWRARAPAPHDTMPHMHMSSNSAMVAKYRYRRHLPHLQKADADLFITFCTGGRRALPEEARDLVLEHCLRKAAFSHSRANVWRGCPRPRNASHESIYMQLWSCPITFICCSHLCAMRMVGLFLSWTFCNASRVPLPTESTRRFVHQAQFGRKSHSIMCCDRMKD